MNASVHTMFTKQFPKLPSGTKKSINYESLFLLFKWLLAMKISWKHLQH